MPPLRPVVGLLAALALGWSARAEADAPDVDASVEADDVRGLLVTVVDLGGQLGGAPAKVSVGAEDAETFWVTDEGELPDLVAGDGVLAGAAEVAPVGEEVPVRLLDGAGIEVWAGTVPLGGPVRLTRIDFTLTADRAEAKVDVLAAEAGGPGGPSPNGGPPSPTGAALPSDITGGADLVVLGLMGLLGSLAGFVIGLLVARSRVAALRLAPPLPSEARPVAPWPTPDAAALWRVAPEAREAVGVAAARALAAHGPVLLCPPPGARAATRAALADVPNVLFPAEDTPSLASLLETAEHLAALGAPFLVVGGPGGIEPAEPDEAPDAVLADLLEDAKGAVAALVLLDGFPGGTLEATAQATLTADGLQVSA